jgi:hypothetical protein
MASWRSRKYLHPIIDYDNYEFFSKMNVWTTKPTSETAESQNNYLNKIKFLEFDVHTGYVLYIPPYWWYSIKLHQDAEVVSVSYQTLVNIMSNISDISQYYFHATMATMQ